MKGMMGNIDLKLLLIGDGPLEQNLNFLVNKPDIKRKTSILPWTPETEIIRIIQQLARKSLIIFIHPALIDLGPKSVIEAQAMGLPVIITTTTGIPFESITYPLMARIAPSRDPLQLSLNIKRMIERIYYIMTRDYDSIVHCINLWKTSYLGNFTLSNVTHELAKSYLKILGSYHKCLKKIKYI